MERWHKGPQKKRDNLDQYVTLGLGLRLGWAETYPTTLHISTRRLFHSNMLHCVISSLGGGMRSTQRHYKLQ